MTLARDEILANGALRGRALCLAYTEAVDAWLTGLLAEAAGDDLGGLALVAVGGYGRAELAPQSDLDVLLLHHKRGDIRSVAERLWYPVWDAKLKLGHAVRTVKEALQLAADDLDTATSLLEVRHVAGDARLTEELAEKARGQWRKRSRRWLGELQRSVEQRHDRAGEVAFLLEPDLKDGRGGLRDVHALRWAEAAQRVLLEGDDATLQAAYDVILDVRVELHRLTGRPGDVLTLEEQDDVAAVLAGGDADLLMGRVAAAARTVAWTSDETWRRVGSTLVGPVANAAGRDRDLAPGVALRDGEIHVDVHADPAGDPALCLRAAGWAARLRTRIDRGSLDRLAERTPVFPDPWPPGALDALVALLREGPAAIAPLETLDQRDLLVRVLPEWATVRSKPQRNAYHRFTVDRHLLETAANAGAVADRVARPDLLVVGALLHDIGKGYPGDHTEVGIEVVEHLGPRMGFGPDDVAVLAEMVRHHLLLPDIATRRDVSDDGTIRLVAEAVGSPLTLELLATLTEADSLATSSAAWSSWKASLVRDLVDRTGHVLRGGELHEVAWSAFPGPEHLALVAARRTVVKGEGDRLTVCAHDRPGLFGRIAGALTINGLDVLEADAHSRDGMAVSVFRVAGLSEDRGGWTRVVADVERALAGRLALEARVAERARTYRRRRSRAASPAVTKVVVDNDVSSSATVVEVRAPDAIGLLFRITHALAEMQLDIRHAKVQTMGPQVVDSFYVCDAAGGKLTDPGYLGELERAVLHGLSLTTPG
ncbi:MAG: [protein-PII] uridylyltransferase [Acidimicrobiales bacterium]|nr:[protein-PII] uridylyltransferase [Acidimicrobiales bacterium]